MVSNNQQPEPIGHNSTSIGTCATGQLAWIPHTTTFCHTGICHNLHRHPSRSPRRCHCCLLPFTSLDGCFYVSTKILLTDVVAAIHRSSDEPVPEEVSLRSELSLWTTARDQLSETSRDPSRLMTFWLFWSPRGRLGESRFLGRLLHDDHVRGVADPRPPLSFSQSSSLRDQLCFSPHFFTDTSLWLLGSSSRFDLLYTG